MRRSGTPAPDVTSPILAKLAALVDSGELDPQVGIDSAEHLRGYFRASDDRPFLREDARGSLFVFRHEKLGRDVAHADVLAQGKIDQEQVVGRKIHGDAGTIDRPRGSRAIGCMIG